MLYLMTGHLERLHPKVPSLGTEQSTLEEVNTFHEKLLYSRGKTYETLTLTELRTRAGGRLNWTAVLNAITARSPHPSRPLTDSDIVSVDVQCMEKMAQVLAETPHRVLRDYIAMQFVFFVDQHTPMAGGGDCMTKYIDSQKVGHRSLIT